MLQRCLDPEHESFRYYGKGITVCERWRSSFENFLADLGPCPSPRHSLERQNGGDYAPGNVIWGTWQGQVANRAPTDRATLSAAARRSASIKKTRSAKQSSAAGELALAAFS
jgi:hypothetical protein